MPDATVDGSVSKSMDRAEQREFAVKLFLREHDRWTQNALVLFGALVAIFALYSQLKSLFPLSLALFMGALAAGSAIVIALCIRASTDSWRYAIQQLDETCQKSALQHFQCHMNQFSYGRDFLATWFIRKPNDVPCGKWRKDSFFSVTRSYMRLATAAFVLLGVLWVIKICPLVRAWLQPAKPPGLCYPAGGGHFDPFPMSD
jgi:hypothetical protein